MANEHLSSVTPSMLAPEARGYSLSGYGAPMGYVPVGVGKGVSFGPQATESVTAAFRVPEAVALATGLTVSLLIADDVNNPGAGLNVRWGVTVGPITSGTSTYDENASTGPLASSTEVLATTTMPATAGVLAVQSVAVVIASMNSLAAGGWAMVRIRRLATDALDTHAGRVVMLGADVRNT